MLLRPVALILALLGSAPTRAQEPVDLAHARLAEIGTPGAWVPRARAAGEAGPAVQALHPSFKAELSARGFELTPFRGAEAPRSLPFAWRRTEVRRGEGVFVATEDAALLARGALTWLDHGSWSERYELREDGVEQSFLLHALPGTSGDLVVRGTIASELRAGKRAAEHASLAFVDERGEPALIYGSALAIDAQGRRLEIESAFDGEHLELRVDGAWLAEAALPLLIDPLVSPVQVPGAFNGAALRSTCLGFDGEASTGQWLVGVVRAFSATDSDVAAYLCDALFANPRLIYLDATTATSDHSLSASGFANGDRWVLVHQRDFAASGGEFSGLRVYFHDRGNATAGSGLVVDLSGNPTHSYSAPMLGGVASISSNSSALLVFQSDATTTRANTAASSVRAVTLDVPNRTLGSSVDLAASRPMSGFDRERPSVIAERVFQGSKWIAVFTERATAQPSAKARLVAASVNAVGAPQATVELFAFAGNRHVTRPLVAGDLDDYWVTWGGTADLQQTEANELFAATIHWDSVAQPPAAIAAPRSVAGPLAVGQTLVPTDLEFDTSTWSHAALTYLERSTTSGATRTRARVARLGGTGGVTETATLFDVVGQDAAGPSAIYHRGGQRFHVASGAAQSGAAVRVHGFDYPADALLSFAGAGCGSAWVGAPRPYAGTRNFHLTLNGATPSSPALYWFSLDSAQIPLASIGLAGCTLWVDPSSVFFLSVPVVTNASGSFRLDLPLPDAPPFFGDVYYQVIYRAPGANALDLALTAAGQIAVR
jgi:hypothetical protein